MVLIYLDNAVTTSVLPQIQDYIDGAMRDFYGNASNQHFGGYMAHKILDDSRRSIADYIGAKDNEIIFTSSGSETNNMALKGFYFANLDYHVTIITTVIEHKSVLNTCKFLERAGCNIKYVDVDALGLVNLGQLEVLCRMATMRGDKLLVSIQFANNEIGTIQNIKEISRIVSRHSGTFHTDAVQAFAEYRIDVNECGIDMMTVLGHKFGCPKGIAFLYKRDVTDIEPLIHGGKQEFSLRAEQRICRMLLERLEQLLIFLHYCI